MFSFSFLYWLSLVMALMMVMVIVVVVIQRWNWCGRSCTKSSTYNCSVSVKLDVLFYVAQ